LFVTFVKNSIMLKRNISLYSLLALFCIGLISLQSCTKLAKNLQYDLDLNMAPVQFTLPATDAGNNLSVSETSYYNVDSFIKANTANVLGINNISSAHIISCVITLDGADTANNFANFQSFSGSIYSNNNTTPFSLSIPSNLDQYATTLTVPVDSTTDLQSYLHGTTFTYTASGALRRNTTHNLTCNMQLTYKVHVQG